MQSAYRQEAENRAPAYWGAVSGELRPALAAQHRLGKQGRRPNPVRAVRRVETRRDGLSGDQFGVPG